MDGGGFLGGGRKSSGEVEFGKRFVDIVLGMGGHGMPIERGEEGFEGRRRERSRGRSQMVD